MAPTTYIYIIYILIQYIQENEGSCCFFVYKNAKQISHD
jgi:hypothetical protein